MKIILPQKPWEHDYGDFVYGDPQYLSNISTDELNEIDFFNKEVLYMSFVGADGWRALSHVIATMTGECIEYANNSLSKIIEQFSYTSTYTDSKYIAVVPIAIITDDVKKYIECISPWLRDSVSDQKWIGQFYPLELKEKNIVDVLGIIPKCILGTGYTDGFIIEDGCFSYEYSKLELDNGDYVLCVNLVWHNK